MSDRVHKSTCPCCPREVEDKYGNGEYCSWCSMGMQIQAVDD